MSIRVTQDHKDQMCVLRRKGWSYRRIALVLGVSEGSVSWHCLKMAVDPPKPGKCWATIQGPAESKRGDHIVRRFSSEDDALLLELERQGLTVNQIANRIGRRWNSTMGRLMTLARRDERACA